MDPSPLLSLSSKGEEALLAQCTVPILKPILEDLVKSPWDRSLWLSYIEIVKSLPHDKAAEYWSRFFERFPTAARFHREYWAALPSGDVSNEARKVIATLPHWQAWSWYFEQLKKSSLDAHSRIKSLDLICERIGYSPHAGDIWMEYYNAIGGLAGVRADEVETSKAQRAAQLKEFLLRAISVPTGAVRSLLQEYTQLERNFANLLYTDTLRNPAKAAVDSATRRAEASMSFYETKMKIMKHIDDSLLAVPPAEADLIASQRAAAARVGGSAEFGDNVPSPDGGGEGGGDGEGDGEGAAAAPAKPTAKAGKGGKVKAEEAAVVGVVGGGVGGDVRVNPLAEGVTAANPAGDVASIFVRRSAVSGDGAIRVATSVDIESALRSLQLVDAVEGHAPPPTRAALGAVGASGDLRQVALWLLLAEAEEVQTAGLVTALSATAAAREVVKRVSFVFEQALLCVPFYPHVWAAYLAFRLRFPSAPRSGGDVDSETRPAAQIVAAELSAIADRAAKYCPHSLPLALMEASRAVSAADHTRAQLIFEKRLLLGNPVEAAASLGPSAFAAAVVHYLKWKAIARKESAAAVRNTFRSFAHYIQDGRCGWQAAAAYAVDIEWQLFGDGAAAEKVLVLFFTHVKPVVPAFAFVGADFVVNVRRNVALGRAFFAAAAAAVRPSAAARSGVFQKWIAMERRVGTVESMRAALAVRDAVAKQSNDQTAAKAVDGAEGSTVAREGEGGGDVLSASVALQKAASSTYTSAFRDAARAFEVGHGMSCVSVLDAAVDSLVSVDATLLPHLLSSDATSSAAAKSPVVALAYRPPADVVAAVSAATAIIPHTNPRAIAVGRSPPAIAVTSLLGAGRLFVPERNLRPPLPSDDQDADMVLQFQPRSAAGGGESGVVVESLADSAAVQHVLRAPPDVPAHKALFPNRLLDLYVALRGPNHSPHILRVCEHVVVVCVWCGAMAS